MRIGLDNDCFGYPYGFEIATYAPRYEPVLQLSDRVDVSDKFRREMNMWLLDMFGKRDISPIPKGTVFMCESMGIAIMRPETVVMLQNIVA